MTTHGYWWLALALGLVVAVVAVLLLHTLLRQVWRVEHASEQVWQAGRQVAGNTANLWVLGATVQELDLLAEEAQQHRAMFGGDVGGEVR
jgi:hypothetical protein